MQKFSKEEGEFLPIDLLGFWFQLVVSVCSNNTMVGRLLVQECSAVATELRLENSLVLFLFLRCLKLYVSLVFSFRWGPSLRKSIVVWPLFRGCLLRSKCKCKSAYLISILLSFALVFGAIWSPFVNKAAYPHFWLCESEPSVYRKTSLSRFMKNLQSSFIGSFCGANSNGFCDSSVCWPLDFQGDQFGSGCWMFCFRSFSGNAAALVCSAVWRKAFCFEATLSVLPWVP